MTQYRPDTKNSRRSRVYQLMISIADRRFPEGGSGDRAPHPTCPPAARMLHADAWRPPGPNGNMVFAVNNTLQYTC